LFGSLSVSVQPFAHAAWLPGHTHFPPEHGWPPPQAAPQAPQFCASDSVEAQLAPHAVVPPGQPHDDDRHTWVAPHVAVQAPQWRGSAAVSTQPSPHVVKGAVHAPTQTPDWHSGVAPPHAWPHAPQFWASAPSWLHVSPQEA